MGHQIFWAFCLLACVVVTSCQHKESPKIKARSKCPGQALYYRQQCYHPIYRSLTWHRAETECQNLRSGSHLATFLTAAEETIVSSHIKRSSTIKEAWIGMHAEEIDSKLFWEWSDGTIFTPGSVLWDKRAPSTRVSTSPCISVSNIRTPGNTVRWVQRPCTNALPFICKYRAS